MSKTISIKPDPKFWNANSSLDIVFAVTPINSPIYHAKYVRRYRNPRLREYTMEEGYPPCPPGMKQDLEICHTCTALWETDNRSLTIVQNDCKECLNKSIRIQSKWYIQRTYIEILL